MTAFALVLLAVCVAVSQGNDKCNNGKNVCVGMPEKCWEESVSAPSCSAMAIIQRNGDKTKFQFQLMGPDIGTDQYVALGIAEKGNGMKDVVIFMCTNAKHTVDVFWSAETGPPPPTQLPSQTYYTQTSNNVTAGNIMCNFDLESKFTEGSKVFDLAAKNYAILFARGDFDVTSGNPKQHTDRLLIRPISFTEPTKPTDNTKKPQSPSAPNSPVGSSSLHLVAPYLTVLSLVGVRIWLV